jgi:hypothetical protein
MSEPEIAIAEIWVFHGEGAQFSSGVFVSIEEAARVIEKFRLNGVLTAYPVNKLVWEWVSEAGFWSPKNERHEEPEFIQRFSSAYLKHHHFRGGAMVA